MTSSSQNHYSLYVQDGGRWSVGGTFKTKKLARARADQLLGSRRHQGVKIVEMSESGREHAIFEKQLSPLDEERLTIKPVAEAPICRTREDLYSCDARIAVARVFRNWLNQREVTAFELLHDRRAVDALLISGGLIETAIRHLSDILGKKSKKEDTTDWIAHLHGLVDDAIANMAPPNQSLAFGQALQTLGLQQALLTLGESETRIGLAQLLGQSGYWGAKIELLADMAEQKLGAQGRELISEILAEILDNAGAIRSLLGDQMGLGSILAELASLASGGDREKPGKKRSALQRLCLSLAPSSAFVVVRETLLNRVRRELLSVKPLAGSGADEESSFALVLEHLIKPAGLAGDGEMAAAVTERVRVVYRDLGAGTAEQGIRRTVSLLPSRAVQIGYLIDLSTSQLGQESLHPIPRILDGILRRLKTLRSLTDPRPAGVNQKAVLADLRNRVSRASADGRLTDVVNEVLDTLETDRSLKTSPPVVLRETSDGAAKRAQIIREPKAVSLLSTPRQHHHLKGLQLGEVKLALGIGNRALLNPLREGLIAADLSQIETLKHHKSLRSETETKEFDLLIWDVDLPGNGFSEFVHQLRLGTIGTNPFIGIVAMIKDAGQGEVMDILQSGVDDILVKPVSMQQIFERIRTLIVGRKPFVVAHAYFGPDRRTKERRGRSEIPLIDIPNTLAMKARGTYDAQVAATEIEAGIALINLQRVLSNLRQIIYISEQVIPDLSAGKTSEKTHEHLRGLSAVAEDQKERIVGTIHAPMDKLCNQVIDLAARLLKDPTPEDLALLEGISREAKKKLDAASKTGE